MLPSVSPRWLILTLFCLEPRCWCLYGSLLMLTISTELFNEAESFKVKYFKYFVWNWVENSRAQSVMSIFHALLHHFIWARVQIWPWFSAGEISTENMCFWGGSGDNLAHRTVVNEAWEVTVPERNIAAPRRICQSPETRLDSWGKHKESPWIILIPH